MNLFLVCGIILFIFMSAVFLIAMEQEDNSIVDIAYGVGFVLVGWSCYLLYGNDHPRQLLLLGLISLWGLRLTVHVALRKQTEQGEDFRYRQWREDWGDNFVWRSFLQIFMLQGAVIYLVALPLLLSFAQPGDALGWLDLFGCMIWLVGFLFETVGDWQLLRFKNNPANHGKIIQHGLWRLTRHPNYFGEAVLWWGVFLVAFGSPLGWFALISPLLIDFLLLKVSGIPMLEAKYQGNPDFEAYKKRTNAFFPGIPRAKEEEP